MKIDRIHVLAFLAVVLPAVVTALQNEHFSPGSAGAVLVTILGGIALLLKSSILEPAPSMASVVAASQVASQFVPSAVSIIEKEIPK